MNSKSTFLAVLALLFVLFACEETPKEDTSTEVATSTITLSKLQGSPAFADASLALLSATPTDTGNYAFEFDVKNYELGAQTEPKPEVALNNSGMGQHIHFIVDNSPYEAHYMPNAVGMGENGRHVVLAFLSRSYHESVKNMGENKSYTLSQYHVGPGTSEEVDFSAPHMFYSRPKGTYKGADTEHLLLDFFLVNTTLSPDGNRVRATINGQEFILDEWAPYVIDGLPKGEATVRLELIDAQGNPVPGPYNDVTRKVTLEE